MDYLIVGAGLTGSVIARQLFDNGKSVLIIDRRSHAGGNVHDQVHESGITIHTYGPHYFRTNDQQVWAFVNRFSQFYTYVAELKALVDGRCENWPISAEYIRRVIGEHWEPDFRGTPSNFEEASLAMMPRLIYEKFVKGYTEKQWGVSAKVLAPSLAKRFDVRLDNDSRLMRHIHQGIPENGYAKLMSNMIAGIPIELNCDFLTQRESYKPRVLTVFTGAVDEYFDFEDGRLQYRAQQRLHIYHGGANYLQPCGQLNNPDPKNGAHIRTLEWKYMMRPEIASGINGTVLTKETPFSPTIPNEYEYPLPDESNLRLYRAYYERAKKIPKLLVCGRLGEYRYYDMDQAIARALMLSRRIIRDAKG